MIFILSTIKDYLYSVQKASRFILPTRDAEKQAALIQCLFPLFKKYQSQSSLPSAAGIFVLYGKICLKEELCRILRFRPLWFAEMDW